MTTGFNWEYDFEPGFPLHIFSFVVKREPGSNALASILRRRASV